MEGDNLVVVDFYVESRLLDEAFLFSTGRELRRSLWRALAPHPALRNVQVSTDCDSFLGLRYFSLAFPKDGFTPEALKEAAQVVSTWGTKVAPRATA